MNGYANNFHETGDMLVERRVGDVVAPAYHRPPAPTGTAASLVPLTSSAVSASAALHSGSWPEQAKKSCLNRLDGNSCWARYCDCDDCQPMRHNARIRRSSNVSNGSFGSNEGDWEPVTVIDEQMRLSYEVWGLRQNELPIKGIYIDNRIIPGFKYNVRYLGPDQRQVFPVPLRLLSVGQGYGKRLTFDTKALRAATGGRTAGHFWSDSCTEGYALSMVALEEGQKFLLRTRNGQELGRAVVTWVAPEPADCRLRVGANSVTVRVAVAFKASVSLTACRCLLGCHEYTDLPMTGLAWLEKAAGGRSVAKVTRIDGVRLPDMPDIRLVPAE